VKDGSEESKTYGSSDLLRAHLLLPLPLRLHANPFDFIHCLIPKLRVDGHRAHQTDTYSVLREFDPYGIKEPVYCELGGAVEGSGGCLEQQTGCVGWVGRERDGMRRRPRTPVCPAAELVTTTLALDSFNKGRNHLRTKMGPYVFICGV